MRIINPSTEVTARPIVIVLFGEPGSRKTSVANTAENPFLLDFDRGYDRSINWKNVGVIESWEDVQEFTRNGEHKKYKTIVIDTAKAALDDFASDFVCRIDSKNKKPAGGLALSGYGAIAEEFKTSLLEPLRKADCDLIIIAHSKDDKDNDVLLKIPDVTGGTQALLIRCADQVGYVHIKNGRNVITFKPADKHIGKDTAGLVEVIIPEHDTKEWPSFMANIINTVKSKMMSKSAEQQEAVRIVEEYRHKISEINSTDDANKLIEPMSALPEYLKTSLKAELNSFVKSLGMTFDRDQMKFVLAAPNNDKQVPEKKPVEEKKDLFTQKEEGNDTGNANTGRKSAKRTQKS